MKKNIIRLLYDPNCVSRQIGQHMKTARLSRVMDIDRLAEISGYDRKSILELERGAFVTINLQMILDICAVIGIDWTSLFYFDADERGEWRA